METSKSEQPELNHNPKESQAASLFTEFLNQQESIIAASLFSEYLDQIESIMAKNPHDEQSKSKIEYYSQQIEECIILWPSLYEQLDTHKKLYIYCKLSNNNEWKNKAKNRLFML